MDESNLTPRERRLQYLRDYYAKNHDAIREQQNRYKATRREETNILQNESRAADPERYRQYRAKHIKSAAYASTRQKDKHKHAVRVAVYAAVKSGKVTKPDRCSRCGNAAPLHGHHYLGYAKEHRLDVIWLCSLCHKFIHRS